MEKHFERDNRYVALINDVTGETVVEFRDEDYDQAVEDGFINHKNLLGSLMKYAKEHKLYWDEDRPKKEEEE